MAPPAADPSVTPASAPAVSSGAPQGPGGSAAPADRPSNPTLPGPSSPPAAASGSTIASVDAREDAHWIQADDYFVAPHAFEKGWMYVEIAKMKEPAGPNGALFFMIDDGRDQRSANFYRTRPAVRADLVLGNQLICFDLNASANVYRAPRNKDNARPGRWWLARVTDLSDLGKGYATLAGSYHCAPDALRAIVK